MDMLGTETSGSTVTETYLARFSRRMNSQGREMYCPEISSRESTRSSFPFASSSVLVVLLSLMVLSIHLGGWTWSSWIYALALSICAPLALLEVARNAVISGWASLLLFVAVVVDAGMPQFFGYSVSDLSPYDITAHYLGALVLTLFVWSFIWWARSADGPPKSGGAGMLLAVVLAIAIAGVGFEFLEFTTDGLFGWSNFHAGIDTTGDIIFNFAGTASAGIMIAMHRVSVLRRPFWAP